MKIKILNGPNLNLLGSREQEIYGGQTMEEYLQKLRKKFPKLQLDYMQSQQEDLLIEEIHSSAGYYDGIVLNPGGFTHQSVALRDAISAVDVPVVEVHVSHVMARENFRRRSLVSAACLGSISGFGLKSYMLGIEALTHDY